MTIIANDCQALRAVFVYSKYMKHWKKLVALACLLAPLFAAEVPRKSPEFAVELPDGKQVLVSSFRGKVLCLAFVLTT